MILPELDRLAEAKTGQINVGSTRVEALDAVRESLGHGREGWVCFTSAIAWRPVGRPWLLLADGDLTEHRELPPGRVLSAEVALDETRSLHVRLSGRAWQVTRLVEGGSGGTDRWFEEAFESTVPGKSRLRYRVFWRPRPEDSLQIYRPFVARFVGWEQP